jgi:hypothetical protein
MPEMYFMSITDPVTGAQRQKRLSLHKYTLDEVKYIEMEWKKWIRDGNPYNTYKLPKFERLQIKKPTYEKKQVTIDEKGEYKETVIRSPHMFERGDVSELEMPFETGGVSFALIGSTRSGKSYAMRWLWDKFFKKHITILMTLSRQSDIYKPLKKKALMSCGFFPQLIAEPMRINRETDNHYKFCLIFDDLSMEGKTSEQMTKLLTIGRNCGMSAIICGQKLEMLNATGRANVNFIFCFKQNTDTAVENTVKTYMKSYFPPTMKLSEMCRIYKDATQNHMFFCIDTLNDRCFLSKIEDE